MKKLTDRLLTLEKVAGIADPEDVARGRVFAAFYRALGSAPGDANFRDDVMALHWRMRAGAITDADREVLAAGLPRDNHFAQCDGAEVLRAFASVFEAIG